MSFHLLKDKEYFRDRGVSVMAFQDIYPEGHQSGISMIMHGKRVLTNGDLRFEPTPGQWQPVPKQLERTVDPEEDTIVTKLCFPDTDRHLQGFNPMIYPDIELTYTVTAAAVKEGIRISVSLEKPVPEAFLHRICFNFELFPGYFFGKTYLTENSSGIFPRFPYGPLETREPNFSRCGILPSDKDPDDFSRFTHDNKSYSPIIADDISGCPLASGRSFTFCPEDPELEFTVTCADADIKLFDGRISHNNGWFSLSADIPDGRTENALTFLITPNVIHDWLYKPVVQVSQIGYHPDQPKTALAELDDLDPAVPEASLLRCTPHGMETAAVLTPEDAGNFLRYHYLKLDFSDIKKEGVYKVRFGSSESSLFRISSDVYDRGVWQPVLEYFLPVQMCHMRVNEKYRVWHDLCHNDDARMAETNYNNFDGFFQGPSTLCSRRPGEHVPGLNRGGWHDAGDFDLRVESQAGESYTLSAIYELFGTYYDATTIDEVTKRTEIHQPDGKNDIQQQIVHGLLTVTDGYHALGRLYRGIICADLRQYVLLGDASDMTGTTTDNERERWVFTEDNPARELTIASYLAGSSRGIRDFDPALSEDAFHIAEALFNDTRDTEETDLPRLQAAAELLICTGDEKYHDAVLRKKEYILSHMEDCGWIIAKALPCIRDKAFLQEFMTALPALQEKYAADCRETPYGIPYRPYIWGAAWGIEHWCIHYIWLQHAFPEVFPKEPVFNALNFILGCHPGSNTASFVSGVGTVSAETAYGMNRADWSCIPGGVISGTALIRPDFPELLKWPFLWQQTEYVMGEPASGYMLIVLAVKHMLEKN